MAGLMDIQKHVQKYTTVIAAALGVDVEIIDKQMIRVAGTGIYERQIGVKAKGTIYKKVLKSGESYVIKEPTIDELCKECADRDDCLETLEISLPIYHLGSVVGVIAMVCSTEAQKDKILDNLDSYFDLIKQISEFITIKLNEYSEATFMADRMKLLYDILNIIDKCVIVLDKDNRIVKLNNPAMKELNLDNSALNKKIDFKSVGEPLFGKEAYEVILGGKKYSLAGKKFPIETLNEHKLSIYLFDSLKKLSAEYQSLSPERPLGIEAIVGNSRAIRLVKEKIKKVSSTKSTVLITGESGTGKELVARAIHAHSDRRDKPFVAINCAAIPEALLESELFGYVKGAFSGASPSGRMGKFELANGGVIFLDEIGDMPIYLQVKLLRILQDRKLVRVGSNKQIDLDIRVVAATNTDLKEKIVKQKFSEALYYRLNVIPIEIPNLKERGGDLFLITNSLIKKYNLLLDKYVHTIDERAKEILSNYNWPGNVRELENVVEFMINVSDERGIITEEMLPENLLDYQEEGIRNSGDSRGDKNDKNSKNSKKKGEYQTIAEMEKSLIRDALEEFGYDTKGKNQVAKVLGIGIATLYRKIDKYKLSN